MHIKQEVLLSEIKTQGVLNGNLVSLIQGSKCMVRNIQFATGLRTFAPKKYLRSKFAPSTLGPFS